jgi:hypothetical protein
MDVSLQPVTMGRPVRFFARQQRILERGEQVLEEIVGSGVDAAVGRLVANTAQSVDDLAGRAAIGRGGGAPDESPRKA